MNASALLSSMFMTGYRNPDEKRGAGLTRQADEAFEAGRLFRGIDEDDVHMTVFLATVSLLIGVRRTASGTVGSSATLDVAGAFIGLAMHLLMTYLTA